jgi:hypothetical protein
MSIQQQAEIAHLILGILCGSLLMIAGHIFFSMWKDYRNQESSESGDS